jgi:hypothetical protein
LNRRARLAAVAAFGLGCSLAPLAHADEGVAAEPPSAAAAPAAPAPAVPATPVLPAPTAPAAPAVAPAAPVVVVAVAPCAAPTRPARSTRCAAPQRAPDEEEDEPPKPGHWYGYQTLGVDLGALALLALSVQSESGGLALASLGTYVVGPPIVHFAHGNIGKGFGDLGLRLGLPVGGALVGVGFACVLGGCGGHGDFAGYAAAFGGLVGGASGGVAAMIIDWALLSREPSRQAPREPRDAGARRPVTLTPSVAVPPSGGALGLGGVF